MEQENRRRFHRVAVIKGGPSRERDVSLCSGAAVAQGLRQVGYSVSEVDVRDEALSLPADIEAVFIALHGRFGEDGGVQTILDEREIPYTGSGAAASRAAMDKPETRARLTAAGVPIPAGTTLDCASSPCPLPFPVVVKPAAQGSSLGCHTVETMGAWPAALSEALSYDGLAVVEAYIEGRELTVGLVEGLDLPVIEICAPDGRYDYRAKYSSGVSQYRVPAPLEDTVSSRARALAATVFATLGARGFGRVDFRMNAEARLFVLELNTIPGFTPTSLLPKAAAAAGVSFPALCDRILNMAAFGA